MIKRRILYLGLTALKISYCSLLAQDVYEDIEDYDDESLDVLDTSVVEAEDDNEEPFDIDKPGSFIFSANKIQALGSSTADPNELLELVANTQFDINRGRLSNDPLGQNTIGDLAPAEVSISGGRPFENTFIIDGIATDNQLDTFSQRGFDSTTGSVQSVFIDTDLLGSFEVLDSNVSAEYGDFTGGAVIQETRDPKDEFSVTIRASYSSSDLTHYLLDKEAAAKSIEENGFIDGPTKFDRYRYGISIDLPVNDKLKMLFSATRQESEVIRNALSNNYSPEARPRSSIRDNFLFKIQFDPNPDTTITAQSLWTPYEDQYWRSNLSSQFGGGSSSKINWIQRLGNSTLNTDVAYSTTENSREEDPNHYNFGGLLIGGFGDIHNEEEKIDFNIKHSFSNERSNFSYGLQSRYTRAQRSRPETNYSYRLPEDFGAPAIAPGPDDGSISGTTFLTERSDYLAYEATVEVVQLNAFINYSHDLEVDDWLTLRPSIGVRASYDDFLGNINFAPRTSIAFKFPHDITLTGGWNRYYAKNQLSYALREQNPFNIYYERNPINSIDGNIILSDWQNPTINQENQYYRGDDVDTPYSDEISLALSTPLWKLGTLRVKGIQRNNKDSFAAGEPVPDTFTTEDGDIIAFNRRELTNSGFSEYRSLSLEWSKSLRNHQFTASTTFSENIIAPGTDTIFSNTDLESLDEDVYYRQSNGGNVLRLNDLDVQRQNFNTPFYLSVSWISHWFDDRLTLGFRGRFVDSYTTIQSTGNTVDINGDSGGDLDEYEDVDIDASFIVDSSITYKHQFPSIGEVEFDIDIDNLFDTKPSASGTTNHPYVAGRSFSIGAIYRF